MTMTRLPGVKGTRRVTTALIGVGLAACRERGILQVRVIHGKGTGALRRTVQAILERSREVTSFTTAGENASGWGATIVRLRPP